MIAIKRVLLPTDYSPYSLEAVRYACAFAREFGAELHLLHVLEPVPATPEFSMGLALPRTTLESRKAAEKALNEFLSSDCVEGLKVVRTVVDGTPFVEIIQYARDQEIDLIVLGTHGRSGLVHVLMGSVAERVVRKAPCPVLTVRPQGHQFVMP